MQKAASNTMLGLLRMAHAVLAQIFMTEKGSCNLEAMHTPCLALPAATLTAKHTSATGGEGSSSTEKCKWDSVFNSGGGTCCSDVRFVRHFRCIGMKSGSLEIFVYQNRRKVCLGVVTQLSPLGLHIFLQ